MPEIGACAAARNPEEAVREPAWLSSGGSDGLHLTDLLRPAWERWAEQQRRHEEKEKQREKWRAGLATDPERCRAEIQSFGSSREFEVLADVFDDNECLALKLLLGRRRPMDSTEQAAFAFFSRRLAWSRRDAVTASRNPEPPSTDERRLAENLAADYLDRQKRYVARLYAQCPESLPVREAIDHLDQGGLLRDDEITRLPVLIAAHRTSASDRQARRRAYISWREHAVEMQRRNRRALARLVFDRERAAYELDLERLFFCRRCRQMAIPSEREVAVSNPPECCFCSLRAETGLTEVVAEGLVQLDEDGFWAVCHPPVPAWVTKESARPLAKTSGPHEEW